MLRRSVTTGIVFAITFLIGSVIQWLSNMTGQEWTVFTATLRAFGFTTLFFVYTIGVLAAGALIYHKTVSGSLDVSKFQPDSSRINLNDTRRDQVRYKMLETFFGLSDDVADIPQMVSDPEAVTISSSKKRHALPDGQNNELSYYTIDDMTDSEDDLNFSDFETDMGDK